VSIECKFLLIHKYIDCNLDVLTFKSIVFCKDFVNIIEQGKHGFYKYDTQKSLTSQMWCKAYLLNSLDFIIIVQKLP
jgi:hypothetical protein